MQDTMIETTFVDQLVSALGEYERTRPWRRELSPQEQSVSCRIAAKRILAALLKQEPIPDPGEHPNVARHLGDVCRTMYAFAKMKAGIDLGGYSSQISPAERRACNRLAFSTHLIVENARRALTQNAA